MTLFLQIMVILVSCVWGVLSNRPWWYFGDLGRTSEMPCDKDLDSIKLWDGAQSPSLPAPWNWGATDHGGAQKVIPTK